ncbi:hypothetical protein Moror_11451 [Moniliophthora roreri MCA 2997]|uniref:Uncharacterized protein n=1 Tax=Moniliophthora roreri (strain MCA 2997) TaxID=1381753 RepID=V2WV55_MONRO|nr:hypothetical protein Moror_11451 [Moniliophthora roreri MCA 2997]
MEPLRRLLITGVGILFALVGFFLSLVGCAVYFLRGPRPPPEDSAPVPLTKSVGTRSVGISKSSASSAAPLPTSPNLDLTLTPEKPPTSDSAKPPPQPTLPNSHPIPSVTASLSDSPICSKRQNKWLHIHGSREPSDSGRSSLDEQMLRHSQTQSLSVKTLKKKRSFMNLRRVPSAPGSNPASASFRRRCKWMTKHSQPLDRPRTRPYEAPYFLPLPTASSPVRLATLLKELDLEASPR